VDTNRLFVNIQNHQKHQQQNHITSSRGVTDTDQNQLLRTVYLNRMETYYNMNSDEYPNNKLKRALHLLDRNEIVDMVKRSRKKDGSFLANCILQ
jgi:hypothetical protein